MLKLKKSIDYIKELDERRRLIIMVKKESDKEAWYKSRRMWGGVLSVISAGLIQFGYIDIASLVIVIAGSFGVTSWVRPKQIK